MLNNPFIMPGIQGKSDILHNGDVSTATSLDPESNDLKVQFKSFMSALDNRNVTTESSDINIILADNAAEPENTATQSLNDFSDVEGILIDSDNLKNVTEQLSTSSENLEEQDQAVSTLSANFTAEPQKPATNSTSILQPTDIVDISKTSQANIESNGAEIQLALHPESHTPSTLTAGETGKFISLPDTDISTAGLAGNQIKGPGLSVLKQPVTRHNVTHHSAMQEQESSLELTKFPAPEKVSIQYQPKENISEKTTPLFSFSGKDSIAPSTDKDSTSSGKMFFGVEKANKESNGDNFLDNKITGDQSSRNGNDMPQNGKPLPPLNIQTGMAQQPENADTKLADPASASIIGSATVSPSATTPPSQNRDTGSVNITQQILQTVHPAGTKEWNMEIGNHIRWMGKSNITSAEIQLKPVELGMIEIQVLTKDDQTTVNFVAANNSTKELIESSLPRLRELLVSTGLNLSDTSVSQQDIGNSKGFGSQNNSNTHEINDTENQIDEITTIQEQKQSAQGKEGQIDYYV